jgi:hypothetical protein
MALPPNKGSEWPKFVYISDTEWKVAKDSAEESSIRASLLPKEPRFRGKPAKRRAGFEEEQCQPQDN